MDLGILAGQTAQIKTVWGRYNLGKIIYGKYYKNNLDDKNCKIIQFNHRFL